LRLSQTRGQCQKSDSGAGSQGCSHHPGSLPYGALAPVPPSAPKSLREQGLPGGQRRNNKPPFVVLIR
jgi:hypothetical protein